MNVLKSLFVIMTVALLASCNTSNRPKVHDTVEGTPTNADTVLYRSQMHATDSLAKPHPTPAVFSR